MVKAVQSEEGLQEYLGVLEREERVICSCTACAIVVACTLGLLLAVAASLSVQQARQ